MPARIRALGASLAQVIDEKWVARRYYVLAAAAVVFAGIWLDLSSAWSSDWSRIMVSTRSFSTAPTNGDIIAPVMLVVLYPLTFLGVRTAWLICSPLCMALGLVTIWCVEQIAKEVGLGSDRVRQRVILLGGPFLMYAWALPGARWGHADDVVALTCVAIAGLAIVRNQWIAASVAIAVAIDAKPWAVLVLPLAAACEGRRLRGLVLALVVAGLPWVPFYIAQHGHLASLSLPVTADSDLRLLGVAVGATPGWVRALQFAVAVPLGAYAVLKHRWYLVPAIAFAVRINLDPVTVPYYTTGAILGLFVWDVVHPHRFWGVRTALGCIVLVLVPSYLWGVNGYGAVWPLIIALRLLAAVPPIAATFGAMPRRTRRPRMDSSAQPTSP